MAGCAGWGIGRIREEQGRIQHLRGMISIIRRIRDEISYGKHTLPEICLILAECCSPLYQSHFRQIYEQMEHGDRPAFNRIWERQLEECLQNAPLSEEEKNILKYLPQNMWMQEEKLQAESIGRSVELLARNCRRAEDAYENKARMIFSVSVLTGIFLAILLL